jgi:hypothetical protein
MGFLKNVEVLTELGWEILSKLPPALSYPCQVVLNSTTIMVINSPGGDTYFFNTESNVWVQGPAQTMFRYSSNCAQIKKNSNSQEMSTIIAGGGNDNGPVSTVVILDAGENAWRRGPDLPVLLGSSRMVEGPDGGAVVIGGSLDIGYTYSNSLYYLPHAGPGAVWTKMDQKLKTARTQHVAFLVPDEYC